MSFTIGSLFDGSGGFPLAAFMNGGVPLWASEIEPYPIAVTKSRFPHMKHLGSITEIKGYEVEPVSVLSFGAPCQDLSVAGLRKGIRHGDLGDEETTRSGLFMEAVRIIKEMREATNGKYPRFAIYENVPGAFSSSKGEDWRIVLEELIKIVEPAAVMPPVPKNGWPYADSYCGDGWSLSYRILDSQFWGVPQRRRRVYLVLDLGGECAEEVLFKSDGLRGYFAEGRSPWQAIARNVANCAGATDCGVNCVSVLNPWDSQGNQVHDSTGDNVYPCLRGCGGAGYQAGYVFAAEGCDSDSHGTPHAVAYSFDSLASNSMKSKNPHSGCRAVEVAKCLDTTDPNPSKNQGGIAIVEQIVLDDQGGSQIPVRTDGKSPTLRAEMHGNVPCVMEPTAALESECVDFGRTADRIYINPKTSVTLSAQGGGMGAKTGLYCLPAYCLQGNGDGSTSPTITGDHNNRVTDYTCLCCEPVCYNGENITSPFNKTDPKPGDPCHTLGTDSRNYLVEPTYCIQGSMVGRDHKNGPQGDGVNEDKCFTLNTIDRHAVAYCTDVGWLNSTEDQSPTLLARQYKDPHLVAYGVDCRNLTENEEVYPTMQAKPNGGQSLNYSGAVRVRYIVRRLTPKECSRLQGFPDFWGHPDVKTELTDEEYNFWLNVRNTHAAINGKATKDYTKDQILKWYNKLHTDSSEYKMWGNGVALPCALYPLQGIAEVFARERG